MVLSLDQNVALVFVEALFFGIYLSSLFICLRWLVFTDEGWKCRKDIHWSMFGVTSIIFGCLTSSVVLTLRRTMTNAINPPLSPDMAGELDDSTWEDVVLCTNTNMIVLLADAVLIQRLWLVYCLSRRIIAFPVFLWVGAFVCTVLQVYWKTVQADNITTAWQPVNMTIGPGTVLTPFWGATVVLNIYATIMMTVRLSSMIKSAEGITSTKSLRFLMRVFIESGSMYLIITTSHFIVWWTPNTYAISIVAGMNTPMMAIAFNLILIRTSKNKAEEKIEEVNRPHESSLQFVAPTVKSTQIHVMELPAANVSESESV